METKFQTSFIPKRPLQTTPGGAVVVPHRSLGSGTSSLFMTISAIIFALSVLVVGGAFGWKQYLLSKQNDYKAELVKAEKGFDINHIAQLQLEGAKIQLAKHLLVSRLTSSRIFSIISTLTAASVRFTTLDLTQPTVDGPLSLKMTGYGKDLSTVAFQSDVLNHLGDYGLTAVVKNPVIGNPVLNQNGTVAFSFTAVVNPRVLPGKTQ